MEYEALGNVYRILIPVLVFAGFAGVMVGAWRVARRVERAPYALILALALAGGVAIRIFLLALIHTAEYDVAVPRYQLPGYFLLIGFAVMGIAAGLRTRESTAFLAADAGEPDSPANALDGPRRPRQRCARGCRGRAPARPGGRVGRLGTRGESQLRGDGGASSIRRWSGPAAACGRRPPPLVA